MTDKNALEPVATVTVRSIGGDTVDTIPGRDYVLAQGAAAIIAKLEATLCAYELALEEIAGNSVFGWAQEIAISALKKE